MIVSSHNIEFGYELISVIPYANYLASKGLLTKTISGNDTDCLYYFSPNHEINTEPRSWYNTNKVTSPNIRIHKPTLDKTQFLVPNYKEHYANDKFKFDDEIVIICNRHNTEWNTKPINYFDLPTLRALFELLQDKYNVIYINVEGRPELYDNAPPEPFGDFELLKEYPKVTNIHDLHKQYDWYTFNELQLMLFSNCEKYITMNGGHSILASYFGGENFIYSKHGKTECSEIKPVVNSFYRWYYEFGGQRCIHVDSYDKLIERVKDSWIDCNPVVNVLLRTANRPNFFDVSFKSIANQTYKNINIIVSIDDKANDYTIPYPVYPVFVDKNEKYEIKPNEIEYGRFLIYNLYFNHMHKRCNEGLIMYLDDDDKLNDKEAIQKIVNEYKKGNELIFWRVKIGNKIIPDNEHFGQEPVLFNISGIGFAFHTDYINHAEWEAWKRGDYRVATKLYKTIKTKSWINELLAVSQDGAHRGLPIDMTNEQKKEIMEKKVFVKILNDSFQGGKLGYTVGEIYEIKEQRAKALINHGLAIEYHKDVKIKEPEKVLENVQESKVILQNRPQRGKKQVKK